MPRSDALKCRSFDIWAHFLFTQPIPFFGATWVEADAKTSGSCSMIHLAQTYGIWFVAALIALECSGVPVPGETTLIGSALYAGTSHKVSVWMVIAAAIFGAIVGNIIGYSLGRIFGYRLLVRYGSYLRLSERRLKVGQYLFNHYGIAVVIVGRFVPLLRSMAPLLAGVNRMPLRPFLAATIVSAVVWVMFVGAAAFYFGHEIMRLSTTAIIIVGLLVIVLLPTIAVLISRHESQLQIKAEQEIPGFLPRA
jgi:membrane protein DedA with SNARE-associated domain